MIVVCLDIHLNVVGTSVCYCYVSPIPAKFQVNSVLLLCRAANNFCQEA